MHFQMIFTLQSFLGDTVSSKPDPGMNYTQVVSSSSYKIVIKQKA